MSKGGDDGVGIVSLMTRMADQGFMDILRDDTQWHCTVYTYQGWTRVDLATGSGDYLYDAVKAAHDALPKIDTQQTKGD